MSPAHAVVTPPRGEAGAPAGPHPAADARPAGAPGHALSTYGARLLAITVAALVARLLFLDHQPLWRDEAFTQVTVRRGWLDMLDVVRHDSAPPLSYILTHLTVSLWDSTWMLRLPAVLAGVAAVPLGAALGRRVAGDRGGLGAAAVLAVSPAFVLSGRDARMYALAGTLTLAVALAAWRAAERPDRGRLVALALAVAAALMTQYLTAIAIAATGLAVVAVLRPGRRTVFRCGGAAAAGFVPLLLWLPVAAPQLQHAGSPFWVKPIGAESLLGVLTEFFAGPAVDPGIPHRTLLQVAQGGAIVLGGVAGLAVIVHTMRRASRAERRATAFVAAVGLGALGILVAISLRRSILDARYASVLWPPLTVLLGVGVSRLTPRAVMLVPVAVLATASALLCVVPLRADVVPLLQTIGARPAPGEVILAHREVYLQVIAAAPPAVAAATHIPEPRMDWFWGVAAYPPGALLAAVPSDVTRIDEIAQSDQPTGEEVPSGFHVVSTTCAVDACLTVWERG